VSMADFDVAVIGGGSGGCSAVNVLSKQPDLTICLIEAGPDYGALARGEWPPDLLNGNFEPRSHDWGYLATRLPGKIYPEPRARVIGGCSSHNSGAAVWGLPADYDSWAREGNKGWSHDEIFPFIDQVESVSSDSWTPYRGKNGSLPTRRPSHNELTSWDRSFIDAAIKAGYPESQDLSSPSPEETVTVFHRNIVNSVRINAAFAFIDRLRENPNLTIMSETMADKLSLQRDRAHSVVLRSKNRSSELTAKIFILAGGVYGSPCILLRSGVGPAKQLKEKGITPYHDLDGVGKNLHDHHGVSIGYKLTDSANKQVKAELSRHLISGSLVRAKSNYSSNGSDLHLIPYFGAAESSDFWILVLNVMPLSRGLVQLEGADPNLHPKIDLRLFQDAKNHDMDVADVGFTIARQLIKSDSLSSYLLSAQQYEDVPEHHITERYAAANGFSFGHAGGTCKMGPRSDPGSVVDHCGRVHPLRNVYVADASIMPQIPRANINLTCMMIGMRVASSLLLPRVAAWEL